LSWYELHSHINRYTNDQKEANHIQELEWLRIRKIWILIINYMRDTKTKPMPFKETDLIKLSFDEIAEEENKPIAPEEVERMFPKTIKTK
jgi:hypothetical protein